MNTDLIFSYPIATASAAVFYALMLALALPASRAAVMPWLAPAAQPSGNYLPGFDTFRGFAAAFVALSHCWWASYPVLDPARKWLPFLEYGAKGVSIFAVLSGFLIYRSVLSIGTIGDLRVYIARRFFRIYPVYLLSVALCLVTGQYVGSERYSGFGFFVSDLLMLRVFWWPNFGNPAAWSLYIEVAFYAFLPLVVLMFRRSGTIVAVSLLLVAMILADFPSRDFVLWRFFLIGILASEISPHLRRAAPWLFVPGVILLALDLQGRDYDWAARIAGQLQPDGQTLGLGLACALILASLPHLPRIGAALNVLPLRLLGLISYSLYLTHLFYILANFSEFGLLAKFGTMYDQMKLLPQLPVWYLPLVFFPGAVTWALVAYLLVERPGIMLGRMLTRRAPSGCASSARQ